MAKLDDISAKALKRHLHDVDDAKAAKRLMVALSYKDGETVSELSERFDIPVSTIYHWLDRFENREIVDAIGDDSRPGRPKKLDEQTLDQFLADLGESPAEFGYDDDVWSVELAREHLAAVHGVEYSLGHVRRILGRSGRSE